MSINGVSISRFPDNDLHPTLNQSTTTLIPAITRNLFAFGVNPHALVERTDFAPQHCDFFGELVCFPVVSIQFVNQFDNYRIQLFDFATQIPQNVENDLVTKHPRCRRCDNWKTQRLD